MGQRSVYDPHDPWAFRNTWTGEIRNSYDDLWIWVTLIVCLTLLALCVLFPIMIHIYCRDFCYCFPWCRCYDRFLSVCHTMSFEQRQRSRESERRKNQQINLQEEHSETVSLELGSNMTPPSNHNPRTICRSYPKSFYPRSITLPPVMNHGKERSHSHDEHKGVRNPSVPRLKL